MTIPEWRVIANLGRHRSLAANRITELGAMDKAKVSRAVARLVDAGLVARAPDGHDNRLVILSLTEEGERVHHEIGPLALAWEQDLASVLDAEERVVLDRALTKLTERAFQFRRESDTDGD
nr:MarR family transcriptional regulator [Marivibrio halodurans]